MNWKNRLTNYNFWISIFSAVLLILQALKIEFDIAYVNEIFTAVLGLLVVIGIISDPTRTTVKSTTEKKCEKAENETKQDGNVEEKIALPIIEKDETDHLNIQDDFKTVLEKISADLETKVKEMKVLNEETAARLALLQAEKNVDSSPKVEEFVVNEKDQNNDFSKTAAAEMENPYVDLMN